MNEKEKKFHRVYTECLKLIHEQGIRAVNHSALSRKANVSRPWIYKYVGDSKDEIIKNAARYFGVQFIDFNTEEVKIDSAKTMLRSLWEGTWNNLTFTQEYPFVMSLYIRYAGTSNVLGRIVDEFDRLYFERLKTKFMQLIKDEDKAEEAAHLVKAIRMGAALEFGRFSKNKMTQDERKKVYESLNKVLKKILREYV